MPNVKQRVLITGGYGNLGSWLAQYFYQANYEVFILSKNKKHFLSSLQHHFIECDITNLADCKNKLQNLQFEFVIHAASFNDTFMPDYASAALEINTKGTRNILDSINISSLKNFIYLSTFHVYGAVSGVITEETIALPRHDYATTHLFAEYFVKQFYLNNKLPYTIIRLTNSYGCPLDANSSKWYLVLNDLAKMAFEQKQIILKGNGKASRDFIWMQTVCEVLEKVCQLPTAPNDVFNLSSEQSFSMLELAHFIKLALQEYLKSDIEIQVNMDDKTSTTNLMVSSAKLKQLVPYSSKIQFKEEAKKIFLILSNQKKK